MNLNFGVLVLIVMPLTAQEVQRGAYTGDYLVSCRSGPHSAFGYGPDRQRAIRECRDRLSRPDLRLWKWSLVAMTGAHVADVASSWPSRPGYEANRLVRGKDGEMIVGRAIVLKTGYVVATTLIQRWVVRRWPQSKATKVFTTVNFSVAVGTGTVAVRNWRIQ